MAYVRCVLLESMIPWHSMLVISFLKSNSENKI